MRWYLGGIQNYNSAPVTLWYIYERGTTVYSGRPTSWVGKVGLIYPSDYGYATSGGATTNRNICITKEMFNWGNLNDCYDNDWLLDSSNHQWTLTPYSGYSSVAFYVFSTGYVGDYDVSSALALHPSIYLKSDIQITGGSGTSASPYEISP